MACHHSMDCLELISFSLHWWLAIIYQPGRTLDPSDTLPIVPRRSGRRSGASQEEPQIDDAPAPSGPPPPLPVEPNNDAPNPTPDSDLNDEAEVATQAQAGIDQLTQDTSSLSVGPETPAPAVQELMDIDAPEMVDVGTENGEEESDNMSTDLDLHPRRHSSASVTLADHSPELPSSTGAAVDHMSVDEQEIEQEQKSHIPAGQLSADDPNVDLFGDKLDADPDAEPMDVESSPDKQKDEDSAVVPANFYGNAPKNATSSVNHDPEDASQVEIVSSIKNDESPDNQPPSQRDVDRKYAFPLTVVLFG